ncbi:MAG TPA: hypothetical protein PKC18_04435 [Lacipirellulaceae bacterium]|nr:hypothetical protein [Lacipirellulaceae bacterium]
MLRVTVQRRPRSTTFRLEGRLIGPWLEELDACWGQTLSHEKSPTVVIDLTGVTFVDKDGKAWLSAKGKAGAKFITADCLTKAIVQEITEDSLPSCESSHANPDVWTES